MAPVQWTVDRVVEDFEHDVGFYASQTVLASGAGQCVMLAITRSPPSDCDFRKRPIAIAHAFLLIEKG